MGSKRLAHSDQTTRAALHQTRGAAWHQVHAALYFFTLPRVHARARTAAVWLCATMYVCMCVCDAPL